MALDNHVWAPAAPMPMAESALYRQRLEVIAEKRRLQEAIRAARRELEEEKLRVQRLKRKTLRDRWLMEGAAEEPEGPEDPPTPESQAQARIQSLEDSLFTLQAQLQLLQSASTGALHRPGSRPIWRRQGQRPLSQPPMEPAPAGQADQDKRASLPAGLAGTPPECPPGPGQVPRAAGVSAEANGPGLESSSVPAVEGAAKGEDSGVGVVEVVWEGLRATEDSPGEPTGAELEARVEAMVLEAIGERLDVGRPDLPAWVRDDRAVVEVVWEGVGGDLEVRGEPGRDPPAPPSLPEGSRRGSPDGAGQGGRGGEDGTFIWVERVTVAEDWEELGLEGTEGPRDSGGAASWELERRQAEERGAPGGGEEALKAQREEGEESPKADRGGGEELLKEASEGGEESMQMQAETSGARAVSQSEATPEVEKDISAGQRAPGEGLEGPTEEAEAGAALRAREEPTQEMEAQPPQKTTEDCLEVETASGTPQTPAEGPSPSGNAAPLVEVTPAPAEQPPECQPLLQAKGPRTNPSAHPVPSYAPARQPLPSAAAPEASETSAPKQKTCQCCAVM
ncbi:paralemmin-3 [Sorex fumeus]|uniref:paralemmin-3 n=1 Tax=Sorex fumeus TaxID=62283 RepID=UPI0024AD927E|nr:paralemmin-3 [Sorex fumeus]